MADGQTFLTQIEFHNRRLGELKSERSSFDSHYRELAEFVLPRRGRFTTSDRNKGDKRHNKIINSKGTMALRTAASGLMANLTSPARPWLRLETPDPDLMEFEPVKIWLGKVETIMRAVFNESNFYNALPVLYSELLLFGTGAMTQVDDFQDVARFHTHTVGSYYIAQNERFVVDVLYREYELQVSQLVDEYGLTNASQFVKDAYAQGNYGAWIPVVHAIEPNPNFDPSRKLSKYKQFRSVVYEAGNGRSLPSGKFLRESGFDEFPAYCPRWDVTGEDIYGTNCPGMTALGDVKQLQLEERRKALAIDKLVNPPLKGPGSLRNIPVSSLPGGTNFYDGDTTNEGLRPVYQVDPRIQELMLDIQNIERRIEQAFYADLFMAITNMEGVQPRNQLELMQRNEEKLLMLGPVIERLFNELLDPLIDRTFLQLERANLLPEAPQEIQGQALKVQYISSLAMAQRAVGTGTIERVAGFVGGLMQIDPSVRHKFDSWQAADEFAHLVGSPPKLIKPDEVAGAAAQQEQQQQQQMMMVDAAQKGAGAAASGAQAAKTLSEVPGMSERLAAGRR
jgi:hypothetical protein